MKFFIYIFFIVLVLTHLSCQPDGVNKNDLHEPKKGEEQSDQNPVKAMDTSQNDVASKDSLSTEKKVNDTLAGGIVIYWEKVGGGRAINADDAVAINFTGRIKSSGKVFDSNIKAGRPLPVMLGYNMIAAGWEKALEELRVGDKVKVEVPASEAYGGEGDNARIPPDADLLIEMTVKNTLEPEMNNGVAIYHLSDKPSKRNHFSKGDKVSFHYVGYTPRGVFFTSFKDDHPFSFKLGTKNIMQGLNLAFENIAPGEKAYIKIPSDLAYGKDGLVDMVEANEPIMYFVTQVQHKSQKNSKAG